MMYGQMTAGSWIYIGSQGIVQGTYETFAEAASTTAATGREMDPHRRPGRHGRCPAARRDHGRRLDARRRVRSIAHRDAAQVRLPRPKAASLDEAMNILGTASAPVSVDSSATRPRWFRNCSSEEHALQPSLVTDQTSAHDPANGYLPEHWSLEKWKDLRKREPEEVAMSARESIASHVQAILQFKAMGIPCVDYGNNIRQEAKNAGVKNAFDYPASCRRTSGRCSASGRAVPLGGAIGRCRRHRAHRCEGERAFPEDRGLQRWLDLASTKIHFQGLPARICWLG